MDELNGVRHRSTLAICRFGLNWIGILAIWLAWGFVSLARLVFAEELHESNLKRTKQTATFPIDHDEPIILRGNVEGQHLSFVLDTGASFCALNADLQTLLQPTGGQVLALTPSGELKIPLFKPPQIEIGTTPPTWFQSKELIACVDLRELKEAMGVQQIGILGMDFLRTQIVWLNFDEGIGSFRTVRSLDEGHIENLHMVKQAPAVLMRLPSEGFMKFMIDTGCDGTSLRLETVLFEKLIRKRKLVVRSESKPVTVGKTSSRRSGFIDLVEFGPHRFFNVSVAEGSTNAIGLPFLRRFDVELDFPKKTARFRAGHRINEWDSKTNAGMSAKRIEGTWIVCDVLPSSQASKSGVLDGDEILSINSVLSKNLTLRKIAYFFSRQGADVRITIKRDGTTREVVFGLQDNPNPFPAESAHALIDTPSEFDQ